jgi:hypothetical protein
MYVAHQQKPASGPHLLTKQVGNCIDFIVSIIDLKQPVSAVDLALAMLTGNQNSSMIIFHLK